MTKKEEAQRKRQEKIQAEIKRIDRMKDPERKIRSDLSVNKEPFLICGTDEAGRGPFAGPVVAGAVILDIDSPEKEILYLNDSKKLSEKKRESLFCEIMQKATSVGVGYSGPKTIDRINILQATYLAMKQAISNLTDISSLYEPDVPVHELVRRLVKYELPESLEKGAASSFIPVTADYVLADAVTIPGISIPQHGIVKGDAKSISIAAASIIAKVTRDHIMYEYDRIYPEYGFAGHKGYGTAAHIKAIREHGMSEIHRRSFIHLK